MSRDSKGGRCIIGTLVLGVLAVVLAAGASQATPTGLNNIPTADVVPEGILVLQAFSQFGGTQDASWFAGFKIGPAENLEVGVDGQVGGLGSGGGPTFQAKYRIALQKGARLALGAANISGDRERHGDFFPYLVGSVPLGERANGHLGYSVQSDNQAWLLGADGALGPRTTWRADWRQVEDGGESVSSLGFIHQLDPRWLIEAWASVPTASGSDTNYVAKLDFVIPLGRNR